MSGKMYFRGIPVEPDLKKLRTKWPSIEINQVIPYEEIAVVLGYDVKHPRWKTITLAWRKELLRTHNFILGIDVPGVSLRRYEEKERAGHDVKGWHKGNRIAMRNVVDLSRVDTQTFNENERKTHDHHLRTTSQWVDATRSAAKAIAPPAPIKVLRGSNS